jgi:hypothetical protein
MPLHPYINSFCFLRMVVASQRRAVEAERSQALPTHQPVYATVQPYPLEPSPGPDYYANADPNLQYNTSATSTNPRARPVSSPALLSNLDQDTLDWWRGARTGPPSRSRVGSVGSNALLGIRKAPRALLKSLYPPINPDYSYPQSSAYHTGMQGVAPMGIGFRAYYATDMSYASTNTGLATAAHQPPADIPREMTAEEMQRRRERRSLRLVPRRAVPVLGDDVMPGGQRRGDGDPDDHITVTVEVQTRSDCAEDARCQREQIFRRQIPVGAGCRHSDPTGGLPQYQIDNSLPRYSAEFGRSWRRRPSARWTAQPVDTPATLSSFCQSPIEGATATPSPTLGHTTSGTDTTQTQSDATPPGPEVSPASSDSLRQDNEGGTNTSEVNIIQDVDQHADGATREH